MFFIFQYILFYLYTFFSLSYWEKGREGRGVGRKGVHNGLADVLFKGRHGME